MKNILDFKFFDEIDCEKLERFKTHNILPWLKPKTLSGGEANRLVKSRQPTLIDSELELEVPPVQETEPGKVLFYPCAGFDVLHAIETYLPEVRTFYFADKYRFDGKPLLNTERRYRDGELEFEDFSNRYRLQSTREIDLKAIFSARQLHRRSSVFLETYERLSDNVTFYVVQCNGAGEAFFKTFFVDAGQKLDVFYYRGDSMGFGGSGVFWLGENLLSAILQQLNNDGRVTTDGSQSDCSEIRSTLGFYHLQRNYDLATGPTSFVFKQWQFERKRIFEPRYGPTIEWHVRPENYND